MKILDWMHRKLHPATNYSRVSHTKVPAFEHDVVDLIDPSHRPPAAVGTEQDTETPLLLHVNLAGILTIGTLGYSQPLFLPHFSEEPKLELPEKEIHAATKPLVQITLLQPATEVFMIKTDQSVVEVHAPEETIMAEPLLKEDRGKKERTTLADLLAAEPAANGCDEPPVVAGQTKRTPASGGKQKKKKVERKKKKKEDELESSQSQSSAAAERIRKMITKMVKKKIHPEAAATGRKSRGAADVAADLLLHSGCGSRGGGGNAV